MTWHCNENSPEWCPCPRWRATGCGLVCTGNDSFQVWRPVLQALALLLARVPASVSCRALASVFVKILSQDV